MKIRSALFVFIISFSGCAIFQGVDIKPETLQFLSDHHFIGHWQAGGSGIDFLGSGTVVVNIKRDEAGSFPGNMFSSELWTGGLTEGSGAVMDATEKVITVKAILGTYHWEIQKLPVFNSHNEYEMQIEHLPLKRME